MTSPIQYNNNDLNLPIIVLCPHLVLTVTIYSQTSYIILLVTVINVVKKLGKQYA